MTTDNALAPSGQIAANPLALYQTALEKGLDPEKLGRLLDLAERWNADRAREAFSAAMARCQKTMPKIAYNRKNEQTHSRYANLEAVADSIKPIYTSEGFALVFGTEQSEIYKDAGLRITCNVMHDAGHSEKYHLDLPLDGAGFKGGANKTDVQAAGSTISYGRRYLTLMVFNLTVGEEDDDGNGAGPQYINAEQIEHLERLLAERRKELKAFLAWAGVEGLDLLTEEQYLAACRMLEKGGRR